MSISTLKDDLRILLMEDHPFQLLATKFLLESYGFTQLSMCESATEALQQMFKVVQPFDIFLCDQCLPDLSCLDLVKLASHQGMIQQAILLSSLTRDGLDELEKAYEHSLPLLGYLIKPLKQSELRYLLTSSTSTYRSKSHNTDIVITNQNLQSTSSS